MCWKDRVCGATVGVLSPRHAEAVTCLNVKSTLRRRWYHVKTWDLQEFVRQPVVASLTRGYCGWRKSCTTLHSPSNDAYGILRIRTGARFSTSTVGNDGMGYGPWDTPTKGSPSPVPTNHREVVHACLLGD